MSNLQVHFTSNSNEWSTPQDFFDKLNQEFNFTLDPCATNENAKCDKFYTLEDDGLSLSWDNEIVFCNPPYGRQIKHWVKKASDARGGVVVLLIPARTCTSYFHDYIYNKAEIRFIRGRLKFGDGKAPAPFPSMLVIFRNV
jgi:phage N-6-adenine-methyltransferase